MFLDPHAAQPHFSAVRPRLTGLFPELMATAATIDVNVEDIPAVQGNSTVTLNVMPQDIFGRIRPGSFHMGMVQMKSELIAVRSVEWLELFRRTAEIAGSLRRTSEPTLQAEMALSRQPGQSLRERLIRLKAGFGLSSRELAEILRCARSSLYTYLDNAKKSDVRPEVLRRLGQVETFIAFWEDFGVGSPGRHLHAALVDGPAGKTSAFDLLKTQELDENTVKMVLRSVADLSRGDLDEVAKTEDLVRRGFGQERA